MEIYWIHTLYLRGDSRPLKFVENKYFNFFYMRKVLFKIYLISSETCRTYKDI